MMGPEKSLREPKMMNAILVLYKQGLRKLDPVIGPSK
jgi:hypothetical protein